MERTQIELFNNMIQAVSDIWLLVLNTDFQTVFASENMNEEMYKATFMLDGSWEDGKELPDLKNIPNRPIYKKNTLGMSWITEVEEDEGKAKNIFVMGPVFEDAFAVSQLSKRLDRLNISIRLKRMAIEELKTIPIVSMTKFMEYGVMLHSFISTERIRIDEIIVVGADNTSEIKVPNNFSSYHGMFFMEKQIQTLVREGNLNFEQEIRRFNGYEDGLFSMNIENIRMQKDVLIILLAQCASAATEGGVASDTAYEIRSRFIEEIEKAESAEQLIKLANDIISRYIRRVRYVKNKSDISPPIRLVADYIELHPEEKLDIEILARKAGYSDYYFSNKFKQEMGISIRDYIMQSKVKKACWYLKETSIPIGEIAELLGFKTQSHFGEVFKKQMGMNPTKFQNNTIQ